MNLKAGPQLSIFLSGLEEYRFNNGGDLHCDGTLYTYSNTTPSDVRYKENIELIKDALQKVLSLDGITYDWKEEMNREGREVGVIAQQVEAVQPELVKETEDLHGNHIKTVDYARIVPLLIMAIREQQAQIEELKKKIG